MNNICISTRFDRYNIFFELWLKNCLNYEFDIVIFLDGKIKEIIDKVAEFDINTRKVFIIDVQKYGNIYEIDNLYFFKEIFNILYFDMQYETIIYTDPDELLLVENFDIFLKINNNFLASKGFELVQNKDEQEYDLSKNLVNQRKSGFWSENGYNPRCAFYNKICVFRKNNYPPNIGRHASEARIVPTQVENDFIFLIHIRDICKKITISNANENISKYQKNHKQHSLYSEQEINEHLDMWFYPHITEIPYDVKKIMIKHNL